MELFLDIGIVIVIATAIALLMKFLKQPIILGYVTAGILIGPYVLNLISINESITSLSDIGVAILLFIAGMELNIKKIKEFGVTSAIVGIGQVIFTFIISFVFIYYLGYDLITTSIISIALTISSTVILVKLLSDKNELNTVHGRIALGVSLIQDFFAIMVLAFLSNPEAITSPIYFTKSIFSGLGLFIFAIISGLYILPIIFNKIGKKQEELLYLAAVSWCFLLSIAAVSLNFSLAIGAFLSGISLASSPFKEEISKKIVSLRDFFATIFFVSLGLSLQLTLIKYLLPQILIISFYVIIGQTIITAILVSFAGYRPRTAFLTAISLAQVSEFSLILISVANSNGFVSLEVVSLIIAVTVITMIASTYLVFYDVQIYRKLIPIAKYLKKLGLKKNYEYIPNDPKYEIMLVGSNPYGNAIINSIDDKQKLIIIDFNPDIIFEHIKNQIPCIYGELGDPDVRDKVDFKRLKMIILTFADVHDKIHMIRKAKKNNPDIALVCYANSVEDALTLYETGADYVELLTKSNDNNPVILEWIRDKKENMSELINKRFDHIKELKIDPKKIINIAKETINEAIPKKEDLVEVNLHIKDKKE